MTVNNDASSSGLAGEGDRALDRFIQTFNSRDPAAWAASLSYPHVRVSPRGGGQVVPTEADYAAAVTYEAADAMGWDHSEWDSKEILAVSADKIHASAQWCRYNEAKERILPNDVSYVITRIGGRWGIQARFGVDSGPPDDVAATSDAAQQAWAHVWEAVTASRPDDLAPLVRLPFAVIGVGAVEQATTTEDLVDRLAAVARGTDVVATRALQTGQLGVNVGVDFSGPAGRGHGLFLVVRDGPAMRVAAASLVSEAAV